jgi:hypothetical protein
MNQEKTQNKAAFDFKNMTTFIEKRTCLCFFMITIEIGNKDSEDKAKEGIEVYEEQKKKDNDCELINMRNHTRQMYKDGVETVTRLYEKMRRYPTRYDRAYEICNVIKEMIKYQTDTYGICRPIKAAMIAGVIGRPKFKDFLYDFPEHIKHTNKSQFDDYLTDKERYSNDMIFKEYIEYFKTLKG